MLILIKLCNNLIFLACFEFINGDFACKLPLFFLQSRIDLHKAPSFCSSFSFSMIKIVFQSCYNNQVAV